MSAVEVLRAELTRAARGLGAADPIDAVLDRPRDPAFGDWTTNLAMVLAKPLGMKPRDLAQALIAKADWARAGVRAAEVAGPGFINFRLETVAVAGRIPEILNAGAAYGRSDAGQGRGVVVEFVSANPTGPLHVGHGRQAALGDVVAALLEWTGWAVSREFYYNDAGVQIQKLATSVQARIAESAGATLEIPEGGYHGEYIREIAERYTVEHPGDPEGRDTDRVREFAVAALRAEQDQDMQAFGVRFDTYYLESSLYTDGRVDETVEALRKAGDTYEHEGALWLRTTAFGDDKDRVMRKSDGTFTYFIPDIAYHVTKWNRGFHRAINVQGSDHHSTMTRVRAGLQALRIGIPLGYPEYVLHQMVTVVRGGEDVKLSKRAGSYVTVRDLIDDVGRDAVRYFFLMRRTESQLSFDVDLARTQSEENPVYYVQMAHARMSGIFRVGGISVASITGEGVELGLLSAPDELELVNALADFPTAVRNAAEALEPHRITTYLHDTAELAHRWYHRHHVLGEAPALTAARLALARAAQVVLGNGLGLLGISAPERM
jgi:arginyl-tRNA synthetase